jgi:DNA-binding MarR family transcriptional regulator
MVADRHALLAAGRAATAELIAEHEATHGPLFEASRARARAFLDELATDERCQLDEAM